MKRKRRNGFTLVELLVVIGIIIVLLGILIPVVSRVRLAGYDANTKTQVQKISAAVSSYYGDFQAYPGAIPNSSFGAGGGAVSGHFASGGSANYTQSEDLVLALLGESTASNGKIALNTNLLGRGPVTYNPLNPEQRQPFMDFVRDELTPRSPSNTYVALNDSTLQDKRLAYATDSPAPEFMDRFPDSRPILYVRGNPGANPLTPLYNSKSSGWQKTMSFDCAAVQPYVKGPSTPNSAAPYDFPLPGSTTSWGWSGANLDPNSVPVKNMFLDASGRARGSGTYLIISAGPDRIFGTSDDVVFAGGGGQ